MILTAGNGAMKVYKRTGKGAIEHLVHPSSSQLFKGFLKLGSKGQFPKPELLVQHECLALD